MVWVERFRPCGAAQYRELCAVVFLDAAPLNIIVPTVTERPSRLHFAPRVSEEGAEGEAAWRASFFASPPFERSRCAK